MSEFWILDGPNGWLNAKAIVLLEEQLPDTNPIQLRWMINPVFMGLPNGPFTIAVKQVDSSTVTNKQILANEDGWTDIEIVGLPFDRGFPCSAYKMMQQGLVGAEVSPFDAALQRLKLGAPSTGWASLSTIIPNPVAGIELTEWRTPDHQSYLQELLGGRLLKGICQMLENVPLPRDHAKYKYRPEPGERAAPELRLLLTHETSEFEKISPASSKWHPLGMLLLAAATDPLAALALGFGTALPFPDPLPPFGWQFVAYRISVPYEFPEIGEEIQVADVVWPEIASARPEKVTQLKASLTSYTPPQHLDGIRLETIGLSWKHPLMPEHTRHHSAPYPVSYAVARFGEGGQDPKILLTRRENLDGWLPYVAGKTTNNSSMVFYDHLRREIPFNVPDPVGHSSTYLVAAQDIFGRWSDWAQMAYQSENEFPQIPGIQRVEVMLRAQLDAESEPGTPPAAHDQVNVDFSWDWTTRRPEFMELRGAYKDDPNQPVFSLRFSFVLGDDRPTPVPDNVIPLNQGREKVMNWGNDQDAGDEFDHPRARYYRLMIPIDFEWTDGRSREFQVEARGQCHVHANISPNFNIGAFGSPVSTTVYDPRPLGAPILVLPEPREAPLWASLPDAAGLSRIVLTWQKVPGAQGYVLYEATESSLLPLGTPTDTSKPLTERLAALRDLNPNFKAQRLSFQRVNQELIKGQGNQISHEVALPRGSRVIHIYAVTAMTENQVESEWQESSQNYFAVAVPRLGVPSPPTLQATAETDAVPSRVQLNIRAGAGIKTSRVELYRTIKEENSKRVDRMGPPFTSFDMTGCEIKFTDHPTPGWQRIWYRAVVWSADDPLQGIIAARSLPSAAVSVLMPPDALPTISDVRVNEEGSTETEALVSWESNVPLTRSPLGYHEAAVQGESALEEIFIHQRVDQIKTVSTTLGLPPMPSAGEIVLLREGNSVRFLARVPRVPRDAFLNLTLKMIDPLGRIGTASARVPQLELLQLPQLSPITFSWLKDIPFAQALAQRLKAEWEILSPVHQDALGEYKLTVRLESTEDIPEPFLLTPFAEPIEHIFTLEQIFASPVIIQPTPNTQQFSIPIDLRVFKLTVTLTDPLEQSVSQSAELGLRQVPPVANLQLAEAVEKIRESELRFSFPEDEILDPDDLIVDESLSIVGVDLDTKVVDFLEPAIGTMVPKGAQIVIHTKPVPRTEVPPVIGLHFQSAEAMIRDRGLVPQEAGFTNVDFEAGKVSEVNPPVGRPVAVGSIVTYVVGSRPDDFGLPKDIINIDSPDPKFDG
jgi:hypothetical protein